MNYAYNVTVGTSLAHMHRIAIACFIIENSTNTSHGTEKKAE